MAKQGLFDDEIQKHMEYLKNLPASEYQGYKETLENLATLLKFSQDTKESSKLDKVLNNQALISTTGALAGIISILAYERVNVITSAAMRHVRFK